MAVEKNHQTNDKLYTYLSKQIVPVTYTLEKTSRASCHIRSFVNPFFSETKYTYTHIYLHFLVFDS